MKKIYSANVHKSSKLYKRMIDEGIFNGKYIGVVSITFDTETNKLDYWTSKAVDTMDVQHIDFYDFCNIVQRHYYLISDATHKDCVGDVYKKIDDDWCRYDNDLKVYAVTGMGDHELKEIIPVKDELAHYGYDVAIAKMGEGIEVEYYGEVSNIWMDATNLPFKYVTKKTLFRDKPSEKPATIELINGVDIPRPLTIEEVSQLTDVYAVSLSSHQMYIHFVAGAVTFPSMNLLCERNIIHSSPENAIEHAKALLLISQG